MRSAFPKALACNGRGRYTTLNEEKFEPRRHRCPGSRQRSRRPSFPYPGTPGSGSFGCRIGAGHERKRVSGLARADPGRLERRADRRAGNLRQSGHRFGAAAACSFRGCRSPTRSSRCSPARRPPRSWRRRGSGHSSAPRAERHRARQGQGARLRGGVHDRVRAAARWARTAGGACAAGPTPAPTRPTRPS